MSLKISKAESDFSSRTVRPSVMKTSRLCIALSFATLAFTATPALAKEAHSYSSSFGTAGSGPAQFSEPQGVAVNESTSLTEPSAGDVYVLDEGNNRVERFSASGAYLGQFNGSGSYEVVESGAPKTEHGTAAPTGAFSFSHQGALSGGAVSGVAVDDSTEPLDPSKGDVYVTDTGHDVIDKFSATGAYLGQIATGAGGEPFGELRGVAVDSRGELWVSQRDGSEHSGSGEPIDGTVDDYSGAEPNVLEGTRVAETFGTYPVIPGFAVGAEDKLYLRIGVGATTFYYIYPETGGEPIGALDGTLNDEHNAKTATGIAVDLSTGKPYVDGENVAFAGSEVASREEFGSNQLSDATGLALTSAQGVYVADAGADAVTFFDYGIVPEVTTAPASGVEVEAGHPTVSATLNGTVTPGGLDLSSCEFEYGTGTSYGHSVPCEQGRGEEPGEVGNGTSPVLVTAKLTGLSPDATYHFRSRAASVNDQREPEVGLDEAFLTPGPGIVTTAATEVASTSAKLDASIEPNKAPTNAYLEYGRCGEAGGTESSACSSSAYEHQLPVPPGEALGEGSAPVELAPQEVQGLSPGTLYHFRVVAASEVEHGRIVDFDGSEATFTTERTVGVFALPDNRQYEMVTPPDKHGAQIAVGLEDPHGGGEYPPRVQAAAGGGALGYLANAPTESEPLGYAQSSEVQVLSARGPGGWSSRDIAIPDGFGAGAHVGGNGGAISGYLYSQDLSHAVMQPFGAFVPCRSPEGAPQPCLSPDASEQTAFLADLEGTSAGLREGAPSSELPSFVPLVTGCPSQAEEQAGKPCEPGVSEHANVPPGTIFGLSIAENHISPNYPNSCPVSLICGPEFRGATPDLSHIVIQSRVPLTSEEFPKTQTNEEGELYEYTGGQLALLSVLPGSEPAGGDEIGLGEVLSNGRGEGSFWHAISADGSRVVFFAGNLNDNSFHLYLRENALQPQSKIVPGGTAVNGEQCAEPAKACTIELDAGLPAALPRFRAANPALSEVFFTDAGKLYAYDVQDKTRAVIAEGVQEVVRSPNEAEDSGAYLYFSANGVAENAGKPVSGAVLGTCQLSPRVSAAEEGGEEPKFVSGTSCNLYVRHDGETRLVTVLSGSGALEGRVSPDGRWLALVTSQSLTGYDNAASNDTNCGTVEGTYGGQQDLPLLCHEVFEYDAASGSLSCASCNPTGSRPVLGASVPSETWYGGRHVAYQPRYLTDEGRVFFDTSDALVPLDGNKEAKNVYEYEPEGVPSGEHACSSVTQSGSEAYKPAHPFQAEPAMRGEAPLSGVEGAGCVALISSGTSAEESVFLDASESGGDVYFLTTAKLAPQDYDTADDIYDAHECTSASPCIPPPAVQPPECKTEAECKASATPQPTIYGTGPSETFNGPGNLVSPPPAVVKPPSAAQLRAKHLKTALAACKKRYLHSKRRRAACERTAHTKFGAKKASVKKSTHKAHR
jgi:hypothetical protein